MRDFDRRFLTWLINDLKWNSSAWIYGFRLVFRVIGLISERFDDLLRGLRKDFRVNWIWSKEAAEVLRDFQIGFKVTRLDLAPRRDLKVYGYAFVYLNNGLIDLFLFAMADSRVLLTEAENKDQWELRFVVLKISGFTIDVVLKFSGFMSRWISVFSGFWNGLIRLFLRLVSGFNLIVSLRLIFGSKWISIRLISVFRVDLVDLGLITELSDGINLGFDLEFLSTRFIRLSQSDFQMVPVSFNFAILVLDVETKIC
ncbi:predicted protein [Arabidopsis lyrata subsp. lyrata]|uniref:Predicted protein n=1 Tax=Arabidopsis lyrata subsp. lyrata TaxID=81972 RepID=D7M9X4_ARALL|nr:predicted protein [Arabidopsis lyrata subsp. lyrata]